MTDPTPRTAATAREALIEKCADAVWNAGHYTFGADLDDLIALAAAERLSAIRKELEGWEHGEECAAWTDPDAAWTDHPPLDDPLCDCGVNRLFHLTAPHPPEPDRAAALVEALTFLSTYEKDPPEVMKDDYAYDRLLAFVHDVAARALAAPAPTVSVSESPTHSWPCPDPDHTYPATPPTPTLTARCGYVYPDASLCEEPDHAPLVSHDFQPTPALTAARLSETRDAALRRWLRDDPWVPLAWEGARILSWECYACEATLTLPEHTYITPEDAGHIDGTGREERCLWLVTREALATPPAPTPSEPVGRCGFTTDGFRCNDTPLQHRDLCGLLHSHTFVCHPFTSGARDE